MSQVDYAYYVEKYGGDIIPQNRAFMKAADKAEVYLHMFTFDRLKEETYDNLIKNCICDMAEAVYRSEVVDGGKEKKSENNDGYSVSYVTERADGQDAAEAMKNKMYGIVKCYLMNTGLLSFEVQ